MKLEQIRRLLISAMPYMVLFLLDVWVMKLTWLQYLLVLMVVVYADIQSFSLAYRRGVRVGVNATKAATIRLLMQTFHDTEKQ